MNREEKQRESLLLKERWSLIVTVTSLKFKFIFWPSLYIYIYIYIAILNSYPNTMSPMAKLKWSAFLSGGFAVL